MTHVFSLEVQQSHSLFFEGVIFHKHWQHLNFYRNGFFFVLFNFFFLVASFYKVRVCCEMMVRKCVWLYGRCERAQNIIQRVIWRNMSKPPESQRSLFTHTDEKDAAAMIWGRSPSLKNENLCYLEIVGFEGADKEGRQIQNNIFVCIDIIVVTSLVIVSRLMHNKNLAST